MNINDLPLEIAQHIVTYLELGDAMNISKISNIFNDVLDDPYIWYKFIEKYYIRLPNYTSDKDYKNIFNRIEKIGNEVAGILQIGNVADDIWYYVSYQQIMAIKKFNRSNFALWPINRTPNLFKIYIDLCKIHLPNSLFQELLCMEGNGMNLFNYVSLPIARILLQVVDDKEAYCRTNNSLYPTALFNIKCVETAKLILDTVKDPEEYLSRTDYRGCTVCWNNPDIQYLELVLPYIKNKNKYFNILNSSLETVLFTVRDSGRLRLILDNVDNPDAYCRKRNNLGCTILHHLYSRKYDISFDTINILLSYIVDVDSFCSIKIIVDEVYLSMALWKKNDINSYCVIKNSIVQKLIYFLKYTMSLNCMNISIVYLVM